MSINARTEPRRHRSRRDATRNDERILDAAREVMANTGPGVSIEEIAARAGVGVGTIYRSFANKEQLIDAVVVQLLDGIERAAKDGLTAIDGIEQFLAHVGSNLAAARHYADLWCDRAATADASTRANAAIGALEKAAIASGALGPAAAPGDLLALVRAMTSVIRYDNDDDAWRRFARLHLAGLRTPAP